MLQDSQPAILLTENEMKDVLAELSCKDYYDNLFNANLSIEQFNHDFSPHSDELRCLHINIHSLNSKLDEFNILVNSIDVCFDVICLSEIWATNIQYHARILKDYNFHYVLPELGIVGGVGIFIHKSWQAKIRNDLNIRSDCNNKIE